MYQRLVDFPGISPLLFSLHLPKNEEVSYCIENGILRTELENWEWLKCGQGTFSEEFCHNNIILSSFYGWDPQAVTRFTFVASINNLFAELRIDPDPSSIQYPSGSLLLSKPCLTAFEPIPTISINEIIVIKPLTMTRSVKLVRHDDSYSYYVLKASERQDEIQEWQNELSTLLLLRDSPHIMDLITLSPLFPNQVEGCL